MDIIATITAIDAALREVADPEKAPAMAAYMKHHFVFLGVPKPQREAATRRIIRALTFRDEAELQDLVRRLWAMTERELHYVANDILVRHSAVLTDEALPFLRALITSNSWWDSVDGLVHVVGDGTVAFPEWVATMQTWSTDPNMWLRRVAILHQLGRKHATDVGRLGEIVLANAADNEFFIRKAIGWALRDLAWSQPDIVAEFVRAHSDILSPLSRAKH